jgi:hypothetical protein
MATVLRTVPGKDRLPAFDVLIDTPTVTTVLVAQGPAHIRYMENNPALRPFQEGGGGQPRADAHALYQAIRWLPLHGKPLEWDFVSAGSGYSQGMLVTLRFKSNGNGKYTAALRRSPVQGTVVRAGPKGSVEEFELVARQRGIIGWQVGDIGCLTYDGGVDLVRPHPPSQFTILFRCVDSLTLLTASILAESRDNYERYLPAQEAAQQVQPGSRRAH